MWYKLSLNDTLRNARRCHKPRIVIHKVHRHHRGHVDFPYLCSSSPRDRSMLSGNILLKFHSTGFRAITQHDVTRALDQCTVVCKRPPLQLAQLSPAIDSQYWQSPQSMAADCGCPRWRRYRDVLENVPSTRYCASPYVDLGSAMIAQDCAIPGRKRERERKRGKPTSP